MRTEHLAALPITPSPAVRTELHCHLHPFTALRRGQNSSLVPAGAGTDMLPSPLPLRGICAIQTIPEDPAVQPVPQLGGTPALGWTLLPAPRAVGSPAHQYPPAVYFWRVEHPTRPGPMQEGWPGPITLSCWKSACTGMLFCACRAPSRASPRMLISVACMSPAERS